MLPDRSAKAFPLLSVGQRVLECRRRHAQRPRGHLDATRFKSLHHLRKALTHGSAQDRRDRHPEVVERQLAGFDALVTQLRQVPRHRESRPGFDEHDRHALVPRCGVRVGLAQHREKSGPAGVADPRLAAVDQQPGRAFRAVGQRRGRHVLQIRATAGLG